jgi:hypothetical protein
VAVALPGHATSALFFLGYFVFEIPRNLILERVVALLVEAAVVLSLHLPASRALRSGEPDAR